MMLSICRALILSSSLLLISTQVTAQDTPENRAAAADRYLRAVPMEKMLEDSYKAIGANIPEDKRQEFITDLRDVIKVDFLKKLARDSMIKTFSFNELTALANFYESPHGMSAMNKFGIYMGEIMPPLQKEIEEGVKLVLNKKNEKDKQKNKK